MNRVFDFIIKQVDALVYGVIGPFSVMYVFPNFFLGLEKTIGIGFEKIESLKYLGIILMNLGGVLAIWCAVLMCLSKKASPSPFSAPQKVIATGPFKLVRHPMMWALHFVIIGQIFVWCSPMIFVWFLIWIRFSVLYIERYEEPYLISIFGEDYKNYCKNTPRWFPKS
ncbi:isoprenylcysteine carboxylmethyltransferase family protein [Flavobacterium psychrophilum]|nr:isoprenylcysteine carboxylmethyltransferase family protein [Flavobacterium psychrophilum]EKT4509310.1 isoprenylcysteine carboxylmethyltransferase family protein [Flavobacterium psychrophilum]ELV7524874.1 isoprenylcysteine carboxylmethyltransferase family protein [Flavobacterium psychrophilum]